MIGSFLGGPEEDEATWAAMANQGLGFGDPELRPEGAETVNELLMEVIERGNAVIADRREKPTEVGKPMRWAEVHAALERTLHTSIKVKSVKAALCDLARDPRSSVTRAGYGLYVTTRSSLPDRT